MTSHNGNDAGPGSSLGDGVTIEDLPPKPKKKKRRPKAVDLLLEFVELDQVFRTPGGVFHVRFDIHGHRETWPLDSTEFGDWLINKYRERYRTAPPPAAPATAIAALRADTRYAAKKRIREVHVRTALHNGKIYVDLCDDDWRVIEVSSGGWRVIKGSAASVDFRRAAGMLPLPLPERGGSLQQLHMFLNVENDADFGLVVAWLQSALGGNRGPYPILVLNGPSGSAKTFFELVLRALVDPNTVASRDMPPDSQTLMLWLHNGHVIMVDNISDLPVWLSEALCRISTGAGSSVRTHYTNTDETLFSGRRPILLNGMENVATRGDLASRSIQLNLPKISPEKRRLESELWTEFEAARPHILGALLDTMATGLQHQSTQHKVLPRMADFARWAQACAGGEGAAFLDTFSENELDTATNVVIPGNIAATALLNFMESRQSYWEGTPTELLAELTQQVGDRIARSKKWPTVPHTLTGQLNRVLPQLNNCGITIAPGRSSKHRTLLISTPTCPPPPAAPPNSSIEI